MRTDPETCSGAALKNLFFCGESFANNAQVMPVGWMSQLLTPQ
jgi:hypothetical protein